MKTNLKDFRCGVPNIDASQFTMLPMSSVELNEGQLPGLPLNPRQIHKKAFEKLKKDIEAYPEMIGWRCLLVYPLDEPGTRYIIIGGNMRYRALTELNAKDAPCIVIPYDTPVDRLQAYAILDNGDFGEWDWDLLANEWNDKDLNDWGVSTPSDWDLNPEQCGDEFSLPDTDKGNVQHMGFVLSNDQSELVKTMLKVLQVENPEGIAEIDGNTNKNGNALYLIIKQWAEQRKLL